MTDREKVIRGLELCAYDPDPEQTRKDVHSCSRCPYYDHGCEGQLYRDALALLKEQKPRVMTPREFDEVRLSKPVWLEVRNMGLLGPALSRYLRPEYGMVAFSLIENRAIERNVTEYYWGWRCWTSRPTPEQMRETPWEETENG